MTQARNLRYSGIDGPTESVTLKDGKWQGAAPLPGSASRSRVELMETIIATGDLTGDPRDEVAVLLESTAGGSGSFLYLAVLVDEGRGLRNLATRLVGDRIQVRAMKVEAGRVLLDVVRAGPNDPRCCPNEVTRLVFRVVGRAISEPEQVGVASTLTPEVLRGQDWALREWRPGEAVESTLGITLSFRDGRFAGYSGCNTYGATVQAREGPGEITLGPVISTRKACEGPVQAAEQRYLRALEQANGFSFRAGRLVLESARRGEGETLIFAPKND
jgi:heat shock protein HslJ